MLVMTLQAVVSSHNDLLEPVIYTSKGIGLLINQAVLQQVEKQE